MFTCRCESVSRERVNPSLARPVIVILGCIIVEAFRMYSMSIHKRGPAEKIARFFMCALFFASLATPAKAGFFEELFGLGGADEARSAPRPQARVQHSATRRHSFTLRFDNSPKKNAQERAHAMETAEGSDSTGARLSKPLFCGAEPLQPAAADKSLLRLHDATLRAGDSIVTPTGILIFRGRIGCPHSDEDFIALADSRLPRQKRDALLSLERTLPSLQPDDGAKAEKLTELKVAGEGHP
ncbi:hypothetical protein [Methylocystis sp. Sn-Cys]|uniref:hypothetical protein n=1 Tax=Methylocystis sp. Sn-Cys TaxID=1701263 RepID=UPI001924F1F2|nr:hypothetical protein [Methylocystis sp. Sn-Cys]MBL1256178.1 hypothetical protein [Methylocystis sp. Sn-Cys]